MRVLDGGLRGLQVWVDAPAGVNLSEVVEGHVFMNRSVTVLIDELIEALTKNGGQRWFAGLGGLRECVHTDERTCSYLNRGTAASLGRPWSGVNLSEVVVDTRASRRRGARFHESICHLSGRFN
jgi:hypothetical protein